MNQFYAGQKVVCINDKYPIVGGGLIKDQFITEGETYVLRWVGMTTHYVFGEYLGVRLVDIDSKFGEAYGEKDCPYMASRFRPLVTDPIAVFRAIAANPNDEIKETNEPRLPVRRKVKEVVE